MVLEWVVRKIFKSAEIIFVYLFGKWWFGYAFKHLWFNKSNTICLGCVFLCKNIINTVSGRCFDDKMVVSLCFYPQTINLKWSFVHLHGNKQSIKMMWFGRCMIHWSMHTPTSCWLESRFVIGIHFVGCDCNGWIRLFWIWHATDCMGKLPCELYIL